MAEDRTLSLGALFLSDESGQDLIEYALLTALVGIVSIAIWNELLTRVGVVYGAADTGVQNLSACTPNPDGSGC